MDLITLARPLWLLLLPLLWFWRPRTAAASDDALAPLVDAALRPYVMAPPVSRARPHARSRLAASLLLLALAGPQWPLAQTPPAPGPSVARILVADLSPAVHTDPARLARLHHRLAQLLDATPASALTGLVIYAGDAFAVAPLTRDTATLRRFLPELDGNVLPAATAAGQRPERALAQAQQRLALVPADVPRQLVWLTPDPDTLTSLPRLPEPLPIIPIDLDAAASPTLPTPPDTGHPGSGRAHAATIDLGPALILAALLLWVAPCPPRLLLLALAIGVCTGTPRPAAAANRADDPRWQAVAAYRAGDFARAATLLAGQDDPTSHYNRGTALARLGDYRGAIAAYETVLARQPEDADARHNADLLRRLLPPPGQAPAPPPADTATRQLEADAIARQWLQGIPDTPGRLLSRKLAAEHARRLRAGAQ